MMVIKNEISIEFRLTFSSSTKQTSTSSYARLLLTRFNEFPYCSLATTRPEFATLNTAATLCAIETSWTKKVTAAWRPGQRPFVLGWLSVLDRTREPLSRTILACVSCTSNYPALSEWPWTEKRVETYGV